MDIYANHTSVKRRISTLVTFGQSGVRYTHYSVFVILRPYLCKSYQDNKIVTERNGIGNIYGASLYVKALIVHRENFSELRKSVPQPYRAKLTDGAYEIAETQAL